MTAMFPLLLLPKRIVYVDDDGRMLDILRMTMPKQMSRQFIGSPAAAAQTIAQEAAYWRGIERLLARSHEEDTDGAGAAQLYVTSYFQDWRRFHLTSVLIVDYAMPGLNGVELLEKLEGCPSRRVMLTGVADTEIAVKAFNSGLIQKFIPKNTPNLHKEITRSSEQLHQSICEHLGHLLRSTLSEEQIDLLHQPEVVRGLNAKVEELDWIEYVAVGRPFGLLGMSREGPLQWLQVETTRGLADLAAALRELGYPEPDARAVENGTAVAAREIRQRLGVKDDRQLIPTDDVPYTAEVFCAVVDLPVKVLTARQYGVDDIRSPEELMRSLVRDVDLAARQASQAKSGNESQRTILEDAISYLIETSNLSQVHYKALIDVLGNSPLDAELKARLHANIGFSMIQGKRNGSVD